MSNLTIQPLQDRLLVKRVEEKEKTEGGIIIPDMAKEKPYEAITVAVGKKVETVKVEDRILFSKYAGTEVNISDEEHLIIREDDVLGIIHDLSNAIKIDTGEIHLKRGKSDV